MKSIHEMSDKEYRELEEKIFMTKSNKEKDHDTDRDYPYP